ncbi:hypothetical protein SUGI_0690370 [Cryptomeria japonica]|uniref:ATP-dependent DNA helicase PIF1 n=1 Tax=Cryptomeria japonica TaxID=3369 RepID=UPI002414C574|nr:ATP-dependent DNA helicase PIF1 [Cryptomeria japonica]GLJ34333.1 hypothetical protein SUGI_0690370 [Cryptomeria japonica]
MSPFNQNNTSTPPSPRHNRTGQLYGNTRRPQRRLFQDNLEGINGTQLTHPYVRDGQQFGAPYNGDVNGGNWVPESMEIEGSDEACEIDDDDDTHFDKRAYKPGTISEDQWRVLKAISQGKFVFVTGCAGTGKSYLLKYAVSVLVELHGPSSVFVTASSGIAACELKGRTLHSFAGIKLGLEPATNLAFSVRNNREALKRWMSAKALIIDEISMIDGELLDKIEYVARQIRRTNQVFGGLQLVVSGDFFQLPPVKPTDLSRQFAVEAHCWKKCFNKQVELRQVFRQADCEFVSMLKEVRRANCSARTISRLNSCIRPPIWADNNGIAPTRLFPIKKGAQICNDRELMALNNEIIPFRARNEGLGKLLLNGGLAPEELYLCEGAQVMLIWNIDFEVGLVNGARGVVVGFTYGEMEDRWDISPKGLWPVVRFHCLRENIVVKPVVWEVFENGGVVASRMQVPLILAWAVSVHKCQGMTLDRVETDLSRAFEFGMVYVALSRIKSLEGLRLTGFDPQKIKAHPKVFDFYESFTVQEINHSDNIAARGLA